MSFGSETTSARVVRDRDLWQGRAKMADEELAALQGLVTENSNVKDVLEIGALNGYSTVNLALALDTAGRGGCVTTIDVFQKNEKRDDELEFDFE